VLNEVVVVGASLGGVRAVEALRREGFAGRITLVGDESHFPPYDRPPLSKEVLSGEWDAERARLRIDPELEVDLALGSPAVQLDTANNEVVISDGSRVPFDGLVIATGASPRWLPLVDPTLDGVFVLRTLEESLALGNALDRAHRVVIVGAGWIGGEVAAACRARSLEVCVIEAMTAPMSRSLGEHLGMWAADLHRANGVDMRLGVTPARVLSTENRVTGVELADGSVVSCDVLGVAVGVAPNVSWLEGNGFDLENGVLCDASGEVIGASGIVAVGDVARWYNPLFSRNLRVEHWSNAVEQADWAVRTLLAGPGSSLPFLTVPYFWSDQYGKKIQYVGIIGEFAGVVEGALDGDRFVAIFASGDQLVGALCVNAQSRMIRYRRLIAGGVGPEAVADILPTSS
jgi:3-phenylpropionate/trans-cinnamate dioxygenase ferredoxin reductase subunit